MKLLTFTLFGMFARQAIGQGTGGNQLVLSLSGGAQFFQHPGKNVSESFTYISTPTGSTVTTTETFFGTLGGNFLRIGYVGDLINFGFTGKNHEINGGIGLYHDIGSNDDGYFKMGYQWVIPFARNKFRFKPGADLDLVVGSLMELGRIDNKNKTLQLLGYTAKPSWIENYSDRNGTGKTTRYADHLSVIYRRNGLLLEPGLDVSTTLERLVLGFEAGWMLQLSQSGVILLQQQDGDDNHNTIAKIHKPHNGSMSGLYVAVSVGMVNRPGPLFGKRK